MERMRSNGKKEDSDSADGKKDDRKKSKKDCFISSFTRIPKRIKKVKKV